MLRKLASSSVIILIACASYAVPAKADTGQVLREIGVATGVIPMGCSTRNIVWAAECNLRAINSRRRREESREKSRAMEHRRKIQRQAGIRTELDEACKMGDQWSCQRVAQMQRTVDPRVIEIVKRLERACSQGDRASCQRLASR